MFSQTRVASTFPFDPFQGLLFYRMDILPKVRCPATYQVFDGKLILKIRNHASGNPPSPCLCCGGLGDCPSGFLNPPFDGGPTSLVHSPFHPVVRPGLRTFLPVHCQVEISSNHVLEQLIGLIVFQSAHIGPPASPLPSPLNVCTLQRFWFRISFCFVDKGERARGSAREHASPLLSGSTLLLE